ncbi:hydroxymethylpyrimidine/phosphomethylpyrimidine kinase [Halospina sp. K52047b]|uniref:bifunctional hydroxymethylpyrimidine kinase/phosphomethylpyrimidine kinase n=1 Tax=Halospina sp. K52047b TaxID=2614160 RepID=UPI00124A244D|nr:hydroxymethylpyrimidine/phosphomethylpyrimidine kinase [Halospina sp. K52047b]KAA8978009.1 hydroxymethylpyrimidine/phosphomethylpyrimidine kinase [Halospina sp. K52047b]
MPNTRPQVLVISGLDPSGGAGIQADIQAITAMGAHPLPVLSCLTVQDTCNVHGAEAVDPDLIARQIRSVAADSPIHAIKTGAMGDHRIVSMLRTVLDELGSLPLVVDPVIKAAGGGELADGKLVAAMRSELFPMASVITPNGPELAELGGSDDVTTSAQALLDDGAGAVLATGGHGTGPTIENRLFRREQVASSWQLQRVGGEYHGSGCTLAAAISAGLAEGLPLPEAIEHAQIFTERAIRGALRVGRGQPVPDRSLIND